MTPERDEIERLRRGGAELGRILDRTLRDALDASGRHDVIGEDGDGDWALVWETLAELRPRAEAAEARLAAVEALHVRTSTERGPDFCKGCSEAAQEWVKWPCPTAAVLARSQAPQAPAEQESSLSWLEREMARANRRRAETPMHGLPRPVPSVRPDAANDKAQP